MAPVYPALIHFREEGRRTAEDSRERLGSPHPAQAR